MHGPLFSRCSVFITAVSGKQSKKLAESLHWNSCLGWWSTLMLKHLKRLFCLFWCSQDVQGSAAAPDTFRYDPFYHSSYVYFISVKGSHSCEEMSFKHLFNLLWLNEYFVIVVCLGVYFVTAKISDRRWHNQMLYFRIFLQDMALEVF